MGSLINYSLLIIVIAMPIESNINEKVTVMQRGGLTGTFSSFLAVYNIPEVEKLSKRL